MSTYSDLIPVNVLTGALGSGKTTLLKALLRAPRLTGTMVLVNELGEIGESITTSSSTPRRARCSSRTAACAARCATT